MLSESESRHEPGLVASEKTKVFLRTQWGFRVLEKLLGRSIAQKVATLGSPLSQTEKDKESIYKMDIGLKVNAANRIVEMYFAN